MRTNTSLPTQTLSIFLRKCHCSYCLFHVFLVGVIVWRATSIIFAYYVWFFKTSIFFLRYNDTFTQLIFYEITSLKISDFWKLFVRDVFIYFSFHIIFWDLCDDKWWETAFSLYQYHIQKHINQHNGKTSSHIKMMHKIIPIRLLVTKIKFPCAYL